MSAVKTLDLKKYQGMASAFQAIAQRRRDQGAEPSETLYYQTLADYHRQVLQAREEGRGLVGITVMVPPEICWAMDIVPLQLENALMSLTVLERCYEEVFSTAKGFGLSPEVCSAHRTIAAVFLLGWAPPVQGVIWSPQVCDNTAKCGDLYLKTYRIPGFFLDRPYRHTEREVHYLAREMGEMVAFLERATGKRLDLDRLREALDYSAQMVALQQEIYELRRAVPHPASNRTICQLLPVTLTMAGTPQAVEFCRVLRDQLRQRVREHRGTAREERYRLVSLFTPPNHKWKLLDWLEKEKGASLVADPYQSHWGPWEPDFSDPLLSLAQKCFAIPVCREMHGPAEEGVIADAVEDALSHRADGAIFWAHIGCRQACATIRAVKEALAQKAGIPTLVLDCDIMDPSFVSEEEMKERLESFLEVLEER